MNPLRSTLAEEGVGAITRQTEKWRVNVPGYVLERDGTPVQITWKIWRRRVRNDLTPAPKWMWGCVMTLVITFGKSVL